MNLSDNIINPQNIRAVASSIALHAFIAACFISWFAPAELPPQQMINVTLVAASAGKIQEQTKIISEEETPQPKKEIKTLEKTISVKESTNIVNKTEAQQPEKEKIIKQNKPSAGNTANAKAAEQLVTTAPVFDAVYLNNPAPQYPSQAKRRGMEGSVLLSVIVGPDGTAKSVNVSKSSGFAMLDASAKDAVSRWKFVPAKRGNETIEARVIVPIEFKME